MNTSIFSKTPLIRVTDNRGLATRAVAWYRHPETPDATAIQITRQRYNERGFPSQSSDPRLAATEQTNISQHFDLTGGILRTLSVDTGLTVTLIDAAKRERLEFNRISVSEKEELDLSKAICRHYYYEDVNLPGRLLSITEQGEITEQRVWANNDTVTRSFNLAGSCICHEDPAGNADVKSISLSGTVLSMTRYLAENDFYTTSSRCDALGRILSMTDAAGNIQRVKLDMNGLLVSRWLKVKNATEKMIVKSIVYTAAGQVLREEQGNGVVITREYEPETQKLKRVKTERPSGHPQGAKILQDLRYDYDPVGNVLAVVNDSEETRFWRNQKIVPENHYTYDSLYRLASATGREMANAGQARSPFSNFSNATFANYTRTYSYDTGGNLTQIRHSAPASGNNHTTNITISDRSNRGVLSQMTEDPEDVDSLFTSDGLQLNLTPGQTLMWSSRGELQQVSPVTRDGTESDKETYLYDANSQRVVKTSIQRTSGGVQTQRVLYLPGLELRTKSNGECLQVLTVDSVRLLHWENGLPEESENDTLRYSYGSLTGNISLEIDGEGNLITQEEYYPYGGTSIWTGRSEVEANYKTVRYSGKERDATGLYYYGWRYYQPWTGRWLSADPAGTTDGLNLYQMCQNNPVTYRDADGLLTDTQLNNGAILVCQNMLSKDAPMRELIGRYYPNPDDALEIHNRVFDILQGAVDLTPWSNKLNTWANHPLTGAHILNLPLAEQFKNVAAKQLRGMSTTRASTATNSSPQVAGPSATAASSKPLTFVPGRTMPGGRMAQRPGVVNPSANEGFVAAVEPVPQILYHYTNKKSLKLILESKQLNPSLKVNNRKDASHGDGQYFSDLKPHTRTNSQLSRSFLGTPDYGKRFKRYIAIDVSDLYIHKGRRDVYVALSQEPLDISHRIVDTGKNEIHKKRWWQIYK
ncbi:TPA: RHS repeat protein [Enterobacter soli]|nr:RHS repeat protein [Enterobacter soli]